MVVVEMIIGWVVVLVVEICVMVILVVVEE